MNASIALAVGIVRTWVALYTLGLPQKLRRARRTEIDCDLWEQRRLAEFTREPPIATAIEMLVRTLLGVISDISWRVEAGASARQNRSIEMNESLLMRGALVLALAIAVVPAGFGVTVLAGSGEWGSAAERIVFASLWITAAVAMVSGLLLSAQRPILGIGLVAIGAIGLSVMWYWAAVIIAPIGVALTAVAYIRAKRTGWPRGAGTA